MEGEEVYGSVTQQASLNTDFSLQSQQCPTIPLIKHLFPLNSTYAATGSPCYEDPYFGHDLCPFVPCTNNKQCVTQLCYEGFCREPLQPLVIFAVIIISILSLFVILGVVYLTSHQRRINTEQAIVQQREAKGTKVSELNVGKLQKNKFDLKSEMQKSITNHNETTFLNEGKSLLFDQEIDQQDNINRYGTQESGGNRSQVQKQQSLMGRFWGSKESSSNQNSNIKFNSRNKKAATLTQEREMHAFKSEGSIGATHGNPTGLITSQNTLQQQTNRQQQQTQVAPQLRQAKSMKTDDSLIE